MRTFLVLSLSADILSMDGWLWHKPMSLSRSLPVCGMVGFSHRVSPPTYASPSPPLRASDTYVSHHPLMPPPSLQARDAEAAAEGEGEEDPGRTEHVRHDRPRARHLRQHVQGSDRREDRQREATSLRHLWGASTRPTRPGGRCTKI